MRKALSIVFPDRRRRDFLGENEINRASERCYAVGKGLIPVTVDARQSLASYRLYQGESVLDTVGEFLDQQLPLRFSFFISLTPAIELVQQRVQPCPHR